MWTERPSAFRDGLVIATVVGLGLCSILSIKDVHPQGLTSQCQDVVVNVENKGQILARCPPEMHIDIVNTFVVCRCGEPKPGSVDNQLPFIVPNDPMNPNAEPPQKFDDRRGIDL